MHVLDFLPGVRAYVGEDSITRVDYARLAGNIDDEPKEVVAFAMLPQSEFVERRKMLPGDDEYVLGSLRIDISKRYE